MCLVRALSTRIVTTLALGTSLALNEQTIEHVRVWVWVGWTRLNEEKMKGPCLRSAAGGVKSSSVFVR